MPHAVALSRVDRRILECAWPRVAAALAWKSAGPNISIPQIKAAVFAGTSDLWIAPDWRFPTRLSSVIVTTISAIARGKKVLRVHLLSGRHIGTWIDSAACTLGSFAQANGCTRLSLIGRRGWMEYRNRFGLPTTWTTEEAGSAYNHHHGTAGVLGSKHPE